MSGPISTAQAGADYRGAFGGTGGDIARVVQQFAEAAKADKLAKDKLALEASLRQQDQEWKQRKFDQDADQFTSTYTAGQDKIRADRNQHEADQKQHDDEFQQQLQATMSNRDELNQDRDAMRGVVTELGKRRGDQADARLTLQSRQGQFKTEANGDVYFYAPGSLKGTKMTVAADGTMVPEHPEAIGGYVPPAAHAAGGHAAPPAPEPTPGVAADGAPQKPVQPGTTQHDSTAAHTAPSVPDAKPFRAATPQTELNTAATFQQLKGLFSDVRKNVEAVHAKPPGALTQLGIDVTKNGLINGIPDPIEKIGANVAMGAFAPKYQTLENSYNALSTFLTQMITGAQMSQQEADRIRSLVAMRAGDNPVQIAQRLEEAQGIIDAAGARVSPRASASGGGSPAPIQAGGKRKWKLADGTVVDLPE